MPDQQIDLTQITDLKELKALGFDTLARQQDHLDALKLEEKNFKEICARISQIQTGAQESIVPDEASTCSPAVATAKRAKRAHRGKRSRK